MSRSGFTNSNYLSRATTVTGYPCTVSIWYNIPSLTGTFWETIWAASDQAASLDMWQGFIDPLAGADQGKLGLWTVVAGTGSGIRAANLPTINTWSHACFILTNATSRRAVNLGNWASSSVDGTSKTLSGVLNETVGVRVNSGGPGDAFPGLIAELAIWNMALSQSDVEALAAGAVPTTIQSGNLISYCPILGDDSPEPDIVGSFPLTINGTCPKGSSHPSVPPVVADGYLLLENGTDKLQLEDASGFYVGEAFVPPPDIYVPPEFVTGERRSALLRM